MELKIVVSLDKKIVRKLDCLVDQQMFRNLSHAIQEAVVEKLESVNRVRLARECAKLNRIEEQELAEEGMELLRS